MRAGRSPHAKGRIFGLFLVLMGVERFLVEIVRAKDDRFLGPFTIAQLISVILVIVGSVLSTVKVVLGPAAGAVLPAVSVAVPAAMEIPRVPSPMMLESVTVRVVPVPVMPTVALALPVLFNVTLPAVSVLELKFASA